MHLLRLKKCRCCCAMLCYHGGWWHDQFFHKMVTYWNMSWPCYPFASRPNLQKVNDGDVHRNLLIELSHGRWHLRYPYRYWNSSSSLRSNMPISVLAIWPQIPEDAGCKYRRPWIRTNTCLRWRRVFWPKWLEVIRRRRAWWRLLSAWKRNTQHSRYFEAHPLPPWSLQGNCSPSACDLPSWSKLPMPSRISWCKKHV